MEESPLHQFELQNWIPISLGGLDISINKAVVFMWIVVLVAMGGALTKLFDIAERNLVPWRGRS